MFDEFTSLKCRLTQLDGGQFHNTLDFFAKFGEKKAHFYPDPPQEDRVPGPFTGKIGPISLHGVPLPARGTACQFTRHALRTVRVLDVIL